MKKIILFLLISSISFAQNANRKYLNFKKTSTALEINTSDGKYILSAYSSKVIETSFIPNGEVFNPESHAVVLTPKKGPKLKLDIGQRVRMYGHILDLDIVVRSERFLINRNLFQLIQSLHTVNNVRKYSVLHVQIRLFRVSYKKLTTISVWSLVGKRYHSAFVML